MRRHIPSPFVLKLMIIVFTFSAIPNHGFAQDKSAEIDRFMQLYHDYGQFNGTVLVSLLPPSQVALGTEITKAVLFIKPHAEYYFNFTETCCAKSL